MSRLPSQKDDRKGTRVLVACCAMLWLVIVAAGSVQSNRPLLLLPVALACLFLILTPVPRTYAGSPGLFVFGFVAAIRYLLLPSFMVLTSALYDYSLVTERSILLMLYEEAAVLVTLYWVIGHRHGKAESFAPSDLEPYGGYVLWLPVLAAGLCIAAFPAVLGDFHLVYSPASSLLSAAQQINVSGWVSLIVGWGRILLPVLLTDFLLKRFGARRRGLSYAASLVIFLTLSAGIYTGISRQSALVPGLAALFYLLAMFPERRRRTWLIMLLGLFMSFALMTAVKTGSHAATSGGVSRPQYTVSTVEAYFNGFSSLETALSTKDHYGDQFSIQTLMGDLLGNFPGLRMDLSNRTMVFYNYTFYGGGSSQDQIIPFTGQAVFHWGFLFLWIPVVVSVLLVSVFDRLFRASRSSMESYLYSVSAVVFGMAFMLNITILLMYTYTLILPGMVAVAIHRRRRRRPGRSEAATAAKVPYDAGLVAKSTL